MGATENGSAPHTKTQRETVYLASARARGARTKGCAETRPEEHGFQHPLEQEIRYEWARGVGCQLRGPVLTNTRTHTPLQLSITTYTQGVKRAWWALQENQKNASLQSRLVGHMVRAVPLGGGGKGDAARLLASSVQAALSIAGPTCSTMDKRLARPLYDPRSAQRRPLGPVRFS